MNNELPKPPVPAPAQAPAPVQPSTVERSVARDGAFSKPGNTKAGKGWSPARGTRFRSTIEKSPGRHRKRKADPRKVKFF